MSIAPGEAHSPAQLVAVAAELEAAGRFREAAEALERLADDDRDPLIDLRIVQLRHQAFVEFVAYPLDARRDDAPVDRFPQIEGPPEIPAARLTSEMLNAAIHHHGCLIVRGLLPSDDCATLRFDIDKAFGEYDDRGPFKPAEVTAPWYAGFECADEFEPIDPIATAFLRSGGGVYAPFAPRAFVDYRAALQRTGLLDVLREYLGAMPVVSVNKCVLRRIGGGAEPSWHQDGIYLGLEPRAVNLWVALSQCGGDTDVMGLDVLPGRQHRLAEQGTHDAVDQRAIAHRLVEQLSRESGRPICRPLFEPGDGILFDQLFIHRSDPRPLPKERYAIESWFFTAPDYPDHLIPVVAG